MITLLLCLLSFIAGVLVHRKHASKAASLEAKGKTILDALKGK